MQARSIRRRGTKRGGAVAIAFFPALGSPQISVLGGFSHQNLCRRKVGESRGQDERAPNRKLNDQTIWSWSEPGGPNAQRQLV